MMLQKISNLFAVLIQKPVGFTYNFSPDRIFFMTPAFALIYFVSENNTDTEQHTAAAAAVAAVA